MDAVVVAMGAWCDYVTEDERRGTPSAVPRPSGKDNSSMNTLHFRIEEFATLRDGRRLILTRDRGWSGKLSGVPPAVLR
ncbi:MULTISPECIES: hypothetical protein [Pseudofrankia]|uniref:hypothetical protein n=1 Tax=Pseudofrankia TaxID=2994363 RepID=UPI0009F627DD|nr:MULTISPECIES: hypothetical protein [Pseudofrankia]